MSYDRRSDRGKPPSGPRPGGPRPGAPPPPAPRREPIQTFDLYLAYPCETEDDVQRIVGNHREAYRELEWPHTKVSLLTQALIENVKEFARNGHPRSGGGYKSLVHNPRAESEYTMRVVRPALGQLGALGVYPPRVNLDDLPRYAFFLQFRFTLARPFLSGDDEEFYIHENPLLKDVVFKVPMVRPSSWKGNLRRAAEAIQKREEQLVADRLFGLAKEDEAGEEGGRAGRLHFYPTFFDRIGLDIINPHSRRTKAGTVPIMLEVVPRGAMGFFSLLYFPFSLIGRDEDEARGEVRDDLLFTCRAVHTMMHLSGFSAKRTRGYGLIEDKLVSQDAQRREIAGGLLEMAGVPLYHPVEARKENTFRTFAEMNELAGRLAEKIA
jgi:CRISPR-associated protein Cmr2